MKKEDFASGEIETETFDLQGRAPVYAVRIRWRVLSGRVSIIKGKKANRLERVGELTKSR
jgi:hypothetical protein